MNATDASKVIETLTAELAAPLGERNGQKITNAYASLGRYYYATRSYPQSVEEAARAAADKEACFQAAQSLALCLIQEPAQTCHIVYGKIAPLLAERDATIAELQQENRLLRDQLELAQTQSTRLANSVSSLKT